MNLQLAQLGLLAKYLPQATPLDPAEDPPGSVDPLGTLSIAERIAEVLFPGFTARMWRPRFLTFAAMAALISERATLSQIRTEDTGLTARLGFERLFVSAVVRQEIREPEAWESATRRLPGRRLARRAGDMPLGRNNFLKGQAVNGPFGVVARLARQLGIVDEDDRLGRNGEELLLAWAKDQELPGLLDEDNSGTPGKKWLARFVQEIVSHVSEEQWRKPGWEGWLDLAKRLRPDDVCENERETLHRLLYSDAIRARCLDLLRKRKVVSLYRAAKDGGRSKQDRSVLIEGVLPLLSVNKRHEDRTIELAIHLADAYEQVASLMEVAFNDLRWGLKYRGEQARPGELVADPRLQPVFRSVCRQLSKSAGLLRERKEQISSVPQMVDLNLIEPIDILASQALTAAESPERLIKTVISRHQKVQKDKGKGMWIEPGERWTLMPGFGLTNESPLKAEVTYLHAFRVQNAYSFLGELSLAGVEMPDGEA